MQIILLIKNEGQWESTAEQIKERGTKFINSLPTAFAISIALLKINIEIG